ncbi:MAG TPA: hypothetical protein VEK33_21635 [Terriglobales bacterium]|nr:hypothetical protein [Terriglobales bacterium]
MPKTRWQTALTITVTLRVLSSSAAAAASFFLRPDPALIRSNALTENLSMPGSWYYAWLGVWERFDTLWYLHISNHGYDLPMAVIFYPLYPGAVRLGSTVVPPIAAALAVSTVAAFFFFWGLLRLAQPDLSEPGIQRMTLLVSVWPTSFVLFAGYAESLTLALILWAVVCARENRWWQATVCAILAGAARPSGVLVTIPLWLLALKSKRMRSAVTLLAPAGWLSYWLWLHWSGRPSVFEAYRLYQGMTLVPPWRGLVEAIRLIVTRMDIVLAFKLSLLFMFAVISLRPKVRIEDRFFSLIVFLQMLMYTGRPLLGGLRYLLTVYPAFVVMGDWAVSIKWTRFAFITAALFALNLVWLWAFLNWSLVL